MKYLLIAATIMTVSIASAAPTYHGILESIIAILESNNEADGPFTYKLCMSEGTWVKNTSVNKYTVTAYRNVEASNEEMLVNTFELQAGEYWSFKSLVRTKSQRVQGDISKVVCPEGAPALETTIQ